MKILQDLALELIDATSVYIAQRLTKFKNRIKPEDRGPIYTIGSADPRVFTKGYNAYSAVDIKLYLNSEDMPFEEEVLIEGKKVIQKNGCVGTVQSVRLYGDSAGRKQLGELTFIVFDSFDEIECWVGKEARLTLVGANEYGQVSVLIDKHINFYETIDWEVSIDSIVTEAQLKFLILSESRPDW